MPIIKLPSFLVEEKVNKIHLPTYLTSYASRASCCESGCQGCMTSCEVYGGESCGECSETCSQGSCSQTCSQSCSESCHQSCSESCSECSSCLGCQSSCEIYGGECAGEWCASGCQTGQCSQGCNQCSETPTCETCENEQCLYIAQGGGGGGGGGSNTSPDKGGSFTLTVTGMQGAWNTSNYKSSVITKQNYGNGITSIPSSIATIYPPSSNTEHGFTEVITNAGYGSMTIYVYCQSTNGKYYLLCNFNIFIEDLKKPSKFYWSSSAKNAMNNHGKTINLSTYEWNNFIDTIIATFKYKQSDFKVTVTEQKNNNTINVGRSIRYSELLDYAKMYSDKVLTAQIFNTVRFSIGSLASTGISTVYKNDTVYGSYFITLQDKLNSLL